MNKPLKRIIFLLLISSLPAQLYGQRFLVFNKDKASSENIKKGDSSFFNNNFKESIGYYEQVMANGYEENLYLNQVQNYLSDGNHDHAVQLLSLMADSGFYKFWMLEKDSVYTGLKKSGTYLPVLKKTETNFNDFVIKNHITKPLIVQKILWMSYLDQYYQWQHSFKTR
ncbi:hypothetical protein H7F33_12235 [Pedobacter sp. PAMC26386]|nr:hypothetical protein H7F33_12235 [Pedobacter sp. PAMC26386]